MPEYIKREAALMKLMQDGCSAKNLQSISDMPAADAAPVVHGQWVDGKCSNCGVDIPTEDAYDVIFGNECRFCYYCGAKMDGGDSDETD